MLIVYNVSWSLQTAAAMRSRSTHSTPVDFSTFQTYSCQIQLMLKLCHLRTFIRLHTAPSGDTNFFTFLFHRRIQNHAPCGKVLLYMSVVYCVHPLRSCKMVTYSAEHKRKMIHDTSVSDIIMQIVSPLAGLKVKSSS